MASRHLYQVLLFLLAEPDDSISLSWDKWWTYDGISGPSYWGVINPEWYLCSKGRRQSPINIDPSRLLFDPNLGPIHIDKQGIGGSIVNTGHSVIFKANNNDGDSAVNISGGPLSYKYQVDEIHIHYGTRDGVGSEHTISNFAFPAEIQIYGFNTELYKNFTDAMDKSQGLIGIAILIKLGKHSNEELRTLTGSLGEIQYKGEKASVGHLSVKDLFPGTNHYITYEGSLTMPACLETVTWIVMNKAIYMTQQQLAALRRLRQGGRNSTKVPLGNNFRSTLPLNDRSLLTNIDFDHQGQQCNVTMASAKYYMGPQSAPNSLTTFHEETATERISDSLNASVSS